MKQFLIACLALTLTACGFTPLYATDTSGPIQIEQIDGRSGHTLRKALLLELAPGMPGLEGTAILTINLNEELDRLTLQPDEAATRTDLTAQASYILASDGATIVGTVEAQTSYNVPNAPFADVSAQIDAADRAMSLLAQRLVDDMRIKLAQ